MYPRTPRAFLEGVWGWFRGSKYLLRRYFSKEVLGALGIYIYIYIPRHDLFGTGIYAAPLDPPNQHNQHPN